MLPSKGEGGKGDKDAGKQYDEGDWKGKGGGKIAWKGDKKGVFYEWWKVFVGHLGHWFTQSDLYEFSYNVLGFRPYAVHLMECEAARSSRTSSSSSDLEIGLNSAFLEFETPGRL